MCSMFINCTLMEYCMGATCGRSGNTNLWKKKSWDLIYICSVYLKKSFQLENSTFGLFVEGFLRGTTILVCDEALIISSISE